ncbi:TPA: restriction endonuclease subunit S [Vibrio parahaemolyticus]|nr:restriction endonuclease subunit S [Vibrio parahaemolyticus]HCM1486077.1 restriction endonuclease subunit S [Vibrio parahaemolyticus]
MANQMLTIGDIAEIFDGPHATPKKIENGPYFLSISSLEDGRLDLSKSAHVSEEQFVKWTKRVTPQKGDLLFSYETRLGEAALMPEGVRACLGRRMGLLRPKLDKVIPEYLLYAYISPFFQQVIKANTIVGATVDRIALSEMKDFPIRIPNLSEQKAACLLLSTIDKKIELNNRINSELEAMAKTLYDYWFVQFDFPDVNGKPYKASGGKMVYNDALKREIPVGWSDGTLDDLGQIVGGSTPSTADKNNFSEQGCAWITPNDLSGNIGNKFISKGSMAVTAEGIKSASLKKYPAGTVLLSSRAPIGYMAIARNALTTNQGFKSFVPSKGYPTEFVYFTVKNSLKAIIQYASGSTFKEVSGTVIKTVKLALPPNELVEEFREKVEDLFKRQDTLEQENEQLIALRDWLLPMLMNGQVTVKPSTEAQEAQHG